MRWEGVLCGCVAIASIGVSGCREEPSPTGERAGGAMSASTPEKGMELRAVRLDERVAIPVPASWTNDGTDERPRWSGRGGTVTWTVGEARGIDPARLEELVRTTRRTVRVKDSRLVEMAGQACIRIAGTADRHEVVNYVMPLDLEHEATIAYMLDAAASAEVLAALAKLENRDAFSRLGQSPRLRPNGDFMIAPIPVMESWDEVDRDGRRWPLGSKRGDELIDRELLGASFFVGAPGTGLIVERLWMDGAIDDAFIDRYVAAQPAYEVLMRGKVRVKASTEIAARLELANAAKGRFQLVYLIRDELRRGWVLSYQAPLTRRAEWVARLRAFEV